jgi:hypothetical protein
LNNHVGLLLVIFGLILISINSKITEISLRYDNACQLNQICNIDFEITEELDHPYIYYELTNFYQNHRRYIKSRSANQLAGQTVSLASAQSDCDPLVTNGDLGKTVSITKKALDPKAVAYPCGLIAASLFTGKKCE